MTKTLFLLFSALFAWGIGEGMFFYFEPLYLAELGADPIAIGAILGGAATAMLLFHAPAGYLADKIGSRPLLRAAWAGGFSASVLMALATELTPFVVGLFLYRLTSFVVSPLNTYVTASRGKWTVERALTFTAASFSGGMILGPLIGGWLGDNFGMRSIYIAALGVFVISMTLIYTLPKPPERSPSSVAGTKNLLQNTRYFLFLGITFVAIFGMYLPQPLTQNFLQDFRNLSLSQIGMLGSLSAFGNVVMNLGLGRINPRIGFMLGQFFTALFALLIWRGTNIGLYGLAYFLMGGYRASRSLAMAQVRGLVEESQMGLAYGIAETVNALPMVLAPPLAGYLYANNAESIYSLSLLLIFVGIILFLIFSPRPVTST